MLCCSCTTLCAFAVHNVCTAHTMGCPAYTEHVAGLGFKKEVGLNNRLQTCVPGKLAVQYAGWAESRIRDIEASLAASHTCVEAAHC